jgi:F-type H+-transporting ATPase subunit delta
MSNVSTLARPYARAAYELAKAEGAGAAWSAKLGFAAQVVAHAEVQMLLASPKLQAAERIALILPEGEPADSRFARFMALLEENGRLLLLPEVARLYEELRAEDERTLRVRVRTAMAIDPVQEQRLIGALAGRFDRRVTLDVQLDPDLIGGAVVEAGDVVIDGSLRGQLARLRAELIS